MAPVGTTRRALLISTYSRSSPYKLGTHHFCDHLLDRGWDVTLVTHPLSPLTMFGAVDEKKLRLRNLLRAGCGNDEPFKEYSRLQWHVPVNRWWALPGLATRQVSEVGWPTVDGILRARSMQEGVDLLYMDNIFQPFWLGRVAARKFVIRLPDNPLGHGNLRPALDSELRRLLGAADLTVCPSELTECVAREKGAKRTLRLGNGVDAGFFSRGRTKPAEYRDLRGAVAVYLGAWDNRVDSSLLLSVARRMPDVNFVIVGDVCVSGVRRAGKLKNLHLIGPRPYEVVPAYLQHADVGLLPFDVSGQPDLVLSTDPLKLYQYLASGLGVVATPVPAAAAIPAGVVISSQRAEDFELAIRRQLEGRLPGSVSIWLQQADWSNRTASLLDAVGLS